MEPYTSHSGGRGGGVWEARQFGCSFPSLSPLPPPSETSGSSKNPEDGLGGNDTIARGLYPFPFSPSAPPFIPLRSHRHHSLPTKKRCQDEDKKNVEECHHHPLSLMTWCTGAVPCRSYIYLPCNTCGQPRGFLHKLHILQILAYFLHT